ncbi:MAG: hypothetical protein ACI9SP_003543 [Arenicella sp.]|jgi:hypothetical protein
MRQEKPYPIGTQNQPWGDAERDQWLQQQTIKRSYAQEVLDRLSRLNETLDIEQYGALSVDPERYPLLAIKSREQNNKKPTALITGGVHGYETSGVQGAIRFIETQMANYAASFNIIVAPCISPWAYETINRWNPKAIDPNRSFTADSKAEESAALVNYIAAIKSKIDVHIDLHETTDTDNSEFRPALAARDNVFHAFWEIPDGFYLVGDTENQCYDFQAHIIQAVSKITHIAPADVQGRLIGELTTQTGVINYPTKRLGLCTGFSDATYNTTTEVYPDSPKVDDENCILAQVEAICSGLDFVKAQLSE